MSLDLDGSPDIPSGEWLFALSGEEQLPHIDGLVEVATFDPIGRRPEEVAIIEKARSYGARAVFFEAERHGRAPIAQAFIFDEQDETDDSRFALLHKRLWSWGGVPLAYRVGKGHVQLFRCAHEPDFLGHDNVPICRPIRTLALGAKIAAADVWWDANRLRNGSLWDDPAACDLMLSAHKSAHRTLVEAVSRLAEQLSARKFLPPRLRRRLLILSLLIAYLEERLVLLPADFGNVLQGATRFFEVLGDGKALVALLEALEDRFNGHVFRLTKEERRALIESSELVSYARLVEGTEDHLGQYSLWRLYSFRDLPVELISNIYQLFVKDSSSSVYTPPALVRLMLEEALSWDRLDKLMSGDGVILDPACGSGVFLVEAYKRIVWHWRWRNGWARPGVDELRNLLQRVHGVDVEEGAVELAAFSLCLSLCDALQPEEIRSSVELFPPLADVTLHHSCFFDAKANGMIKSPVVVVIGNPPFDSTLTTDGAKRSYAAYTRQYGALPDKQLAYLFLHEAMSMMASDGVLAMIEPSGFLYNQNVLKFRQAFLKRWRVRELLDFVSVRGLFKKGDADPKIVVVVAEAADPSAEGRMLHAVFRRDGRAIAEQGFDIDYYDLHWVSSSQAVKSPDVWRANLFGGSRVHALIERLRSFSTLKEYADNQNWDFGEGYIAGSSGESAPADHLIGAPLMPTNALSESGIDPQKFSTVPEGAYKRPKTAKRFTAPLLLIKENDDLHHGLWTGHYLAFKHRIVGFAAPASDLDKLTAIEAWLRREATVLKAFVAATSASMFVQRATAILGADIYALPYAPDRELDLSDNERMIAHDIVSNQRDFIRLGADAPVMRQVSGSHLEEFNDVFTRQINAIYYRNPIRALEMRHWSGAVCTAYVFGDGAVDWSGADELRDRLDVLLKERRGSGLTVTRIARLYDKSFIFLMKPDRHRFWTCPVALRDADDVLADLRIQGF
ncbi:class I SAM-dependent DNA methyltransferase [Rhizobium leguminosarum]|uniref:HsdM family class I SAM-dependent methyltransferase n=1 Tax=Rhizobium leguminosarum TaxID=384 RepID=UPI001C91F752|nr:N-6 DNA methylase [Rhizobium leguminosarum]MBY2989651.1 SAM-dependent DNA methyltransferase [Rhizobium leguminosarum]